MKTLLLIPMALTACGACLPDKPVSTAGGYTKDGMPYYIEAEPTLGQVCKVPVVYESDGNGHTYSPEPDSTPERSEDTPEPSRDEPTDTPKDTPNDNPTDEPDDTSKSNKGNNGWGNGDQSAPGNSLDHNKAENGGGSQKNHGKSNKN